MKRLLLFSVYELQATRSQYIRNQKKIKLDQTVRGILCVYYEQEPERQKSTLTLFYLFVQVESLHKPVLAMKRDILL